MVIPYVLQPKSTANYGLEPDQPLAMDRVKMQLY